MPRKVRGWFVESGRERPPFVRAVERESNLKPTENGHGPHASLRRPSNRQSRPSPRRNGRGKGYFLPLVRGTELLEGREGAGVVRQDQDQSKNVQGIAKCPSLASSTWKTHD